MPALEASLNDLVARHEMYRTTLEEVNDEPWQIVHPFQYRSLPVHDLVDRTGGRRTTRV